MRKFKIVYSGILFYFTILIFCIWIITIAPMLDADYDVFALVLTICLLSLVCCNVIMYDKEIYNKILPKWFRDN